MRNFIPLPETMESAVLDRGGGFRLERAPVPEPGPGQILLRLLVTGLDPRDLDPALHVNRTPPGVPVGEIAAVGEGVNGWGPLDEAVLLPLPALPGASPVAGLAEYVLVPADLLDRDAAVRIPTEMPPEDATLLPATALASRLLREASLGRASSLLVVGLGLVGQIVIRMARHQGVGGVFAADPSPTLRQRAQWSGATRVVRVPEASVRDAVHADTGGHGVDAAVFLTEDASLAHETFQSMAPRGTLILGTPFPSNFLFALPGSRLQRHELRIQGVNAYEHRDLRAAFSALSQGIVNAETLVSKRVAWSELPGAELSPETWAHGTHVVVSGPEED